MKKIKIISMFLVLCGLSCVIMFAQTPQAADPTQQAVLSQSGSSVPIYRVTVTERTMKAINYQHRSGATKIDFRGTDLLRSAHGQAKVESKRGYIEIEVEFDQLQPANRYGAEYLTYVLWAITPEGRTSNLGEVLLNGTNSKLNVTTELQVFGLAVTAEPYFAVTKPSNLVVMENEVRTDTAGKIEAMDAKYELLQRGQYERLANPLALKMDQKMPLELYEARNAVQIARAVGADQFASDTFAKAENSLKQAEAYQARKAGRKPVTMTAREAVQTAEDSRAIAVTRQEEARVARERQAGMNREANLRAETEAEARLRAQAEANQKVEADRRALAEAKSAADQSETARIKREAEAARIAAQAEADRLKLVSDATQAAAKTEADRLKLVNDATQAAAKTEADRLKLVNDAAQAAAQTEAERAARAAAKAEANQKVEADRRALAEAKSAADQSETARIKREAEAARIAAQAEADRLKLVNDAARTTAQAEAERAALAAAKAEADRTRLAAQEADRLLRKSEAEKAELRAQLLTQLNLVLETRDTARGLIINMSDVLFDTAQYTLRPLAREKLAKVAGIILGHAGLTLAAEGHTDSVGGDAYNQTLSEQRAGSVRDYLIQQGMSAMNSVPAKGFGKTKPVASNDTAAGRQLNRRVELIVSGAIIGK
jgi:outer membrane protein OmpA-like peptidoglycan-associated protein